MQIVPSLTRSCDAPDGSALSNFGPTLVILESLNPLKRTLEARKGSIHDYNLSMTGPAYAQTMPSP